MDEVTLAIRQERLVQWTRQLIHEYEHIGYTFRLKIRRPLIEITEYSGRWGLWDPEARRIAIAESLIEKNPWFVVLEILKHEIAHQIVSETYGAEEAHGPLFRRACESLGMAEWAMKAQAEIGPLAPAHCASSLSEEENRLLSRVEKLLSLASSPNEHEAASAVRKVQELFSRHHFDRLNLWERSQKTNFKSLLIHTGKKRVERHQTLIASLLHDYFFVEVVHSSLYDAKAGEQYKVIELLGTDENIRMAEYVYHFLSHQILGLWRDYSLKTGKGVRSRGSFLSGVLTGFREQLERSRASCLQQYAEQARAKGVALITTEDKELDAYLNYRYPRLVSLSSTRRYYDAHSYSSGKHEGHQLKLHRPISERRGNEGKLLGPGRLG